MRHDDEACRSVGRGVLTFFGVSILFALVVAGIIAAVTYDCP